MAGTTYYNVANVLGVSFNNCPCWKDLDGLPVGDYGKKCTDPASSHENCKATVRCVGGVNVKYEFTCDENSATAGFIRKNTATGLIEVVNWVSET